MTIWGEHTGHVADLESLLTEKDVHVLALSTGAELGSQLLQFVVFGQTKQKGPPVILLQGVQQVLRRRGLGTWALQFLYRACSKSRELLAKGYRRDGYMDFLTAKGFILKGGSVKLASADDRYPTVGDYVCRRPQRQTWVQTSRHCRPSTIALQLSRQTRKPHDKVSTEQRDQRFNP
jgi:hypothetical protein